MNATLITLDNLADYNADYYYILEADFNTAWGVARRLVKALATVDDLLALATTEPKAFNAALRLNTKAFKVSPARWD